MPMAVTIRPARPEDLVAIVALLQEHHLPLEGLADHLSTTMVASLFERIERAEVPPSVQRSVEFTSACPSSAIVMRKILRK